MNAITSKVTCPHCHKAFYREESYNKRNKIVEVCNDEGKRHTAKEIADIVGCHPGYVSSVARELSLKLKPTPYYPQLSPMLKRNQEMFKRSKAGETGRALAKDFGISTARVYQILQRLYWRESRKHDKNDY